MRSMSIPMEPFISWFEISVQYTYITLYHISIYIYIICICIFIIYVYIYIHIYTQIYKYGIYWHWCVWAAWQAQAEALFQKADLRSPPRSDLFAMATPLTLSIGSLGKEPFDVDVLETYTVSAAWRWKPVEVECWEAVEHFWGRSGKF